VQAKIVEANTSDTSGGLGVEIGLDGRTPRALGIADGVVEVLSIGGASGVKLVNKLQDEKRDKNDFHRRFLTL
jgi:hypothetical protein